MLFLKILLILVIWTLGGFFFWKLISGRIFKGARDEDANSKISNKETFYKREKS